MQRTVTPAVEFMERLARWLVRCASCCERAARPPPRPSSQHAAPLHGARAAGAERVPPQGRVEHSQQLALRIVVVDLWLALCELLCERATATRLLGGGRTESYRLRAVLAPHHPVAAR
jgi:hypothetical protein